MWRCSETIQAEDNFSCKKFADLAAGRQLASSSTHKRRRKDRDRVHDALLQALMDGVGSTHDKLMGLEAIDSRSGLFLHKKLANINLFFGEETIPINSSGLFMVARLKIDLS